MSFGSGLRGRFAALRSIFKEARSDESVLDTAELPSKASERPPRNAHHVT
jgi:hypothetical protein